ncbi:MAG: hypothetical protein E7177_01695 [Erysipelotrichaceae bacterium]|nr:hypothetical protein [Erysipelotrichaceae bacterium]
MKRKEGLKLGILILIIIIAGFGIMFYSLSPKLSEFRNSIYGIILNVLFIFGIIIFLCFSKTINLPFLGKCTLLIYGLLYLLFIIIDLGKVEAIFFFLYSIYAIIVSIYLYKKYEKEFKSIWIFGAISYLTSVVFVFRVNYINGEMNKTFLMTTIILTMLAFGGCLIYSLVHYSVHNNKEKLITIPLFGAFVTFLFSWLTISSMNIYLDFSLPRYEQFIIIDKEIDTGAKKITNYEFEVKKDDVTFTIGVSEEVYYTYDIGETIVLSIYDGAFNEPYYMHDSEKRG